MKLDIYKCDRCGGEMRLREGEKPKTVLLDAELDEENRRTKHLCEDCQAGLDYFFMYPADFDELANKLSKMEEAE